MSDFSRRCAPAASRHLDVGLNGHITQSEIEGGVFLGDVPPGCCLELETRNHTYHLIHQGGCRALIWGHPLLCPEPVEVAVLGSNWGGSLLKTAFVGRGMRLEFRHPSHNVVTTSSILSIREHSR